mmetsp:Transcript_8351/g.20834  ORF Transcript_8351/g.20834 Transcript_8351/m.20834 type:complete len:193 (+) Transcript_8351:455-1033(+)
MIEKYLPETEDHPSVFSLHAACFVCSLCGTLPAEQEQNPGPPNRDVFTGKLGFLCKTIPTSTISCVYDYDEYVATKRRLKSLDNFPRDQLQNNLLERCVVFDRNERNDSQVRKVMVTDQDVGRKHATTLRPSSGSSVGSRITSRSAPLAVLRDRICRHEFKRKISLSWPDKKKWDMAFLELLDAFFLVSPNN